VSISPTSAESALHRLAEREATLREIFDTALDIITVTRYEDGSFVQVNEQFSRLTGYSADEVLNVPSAQAGLLAEVGERDAILRGLERDGCVRNFELSLKLKDGTIVPFLLNAVPIEVDGERCILTTGRDIRDNQGIAAQS